MPVPKNALRGAPYSLPQPEHPTRVGEAAQVPLRQQDDAARDVPPVRKRGLSPAAEVVLLIPGVFGSEKRIRVDELPCGMRPVPKSAFWAYPYVEPITRTARARQNPLGAQSDATPRLGLVELLHEDCYLRGTQIRAGPEACGARQRDER